MRISIFAFLLAFAVACPGFAQETSPEVVPQEKTPVFRQNVNLVNVLFNVKSNHGALVPGLTQDHFELLEEGKPQTIKYFSAETNQPLTLWILSDTRLSIKKILPEQQAIPRDFLLHVPTAH